MSSTPLPTFRSVTAQGLDLAAWESDRGIEMAFPVYATRPAEARRALLEALGLESVDNVAFNVETER